VLLSTKHNGQYHFFSTCHSYLTKSLPQPPKAAAAADGLQLSLRFKHGIHTIFLFVDPLEKFSDVTQQLLAALRARYSAEGLTSFDQPDRAIKIPANEEGQTLHYAVLADPTDASQGWKDLKIRDDVDTPAGKRLKPNDMLAFAFAGADEEAQFVVDWPEAGEEEDDAMPATSSRTAGRKANGTKAEILDSED
jgi:hypothetical protein